MNAGCFTVGVPLQTSFANLCQSTRRRLRITQQQLAQRTGVSRGYIANIELGVANPTLQMVERVSTVLELDIQLIARPPMIIGRGQRDLVHARCSAHAEGRFRSAGWLTAREVEVVHARSHGWIDLLAFDPRDRTLVIAEIKTRLDDVGAIERQLAWYERSASTVVSQLGWSPRRSVGWLLLLASDEVEVALRANKELLALAFPVRATAMTVAVVSGNPTIGGRGMALIDPSTKRRRWLIPSKLDGRRSELPYTDYAGAAARFSAEARASRRRASGI